MNKFFQRSLTSLLLLFGLFSQATMAVIITDISHSGTDVGGVDLFISEDAMKGNPANETAWVNSVLAMSDATFAIKTEGGQYYETDTPNVFALQLESTSPGFFLIKNARRVALFYNSGALDWGVFNVSMLSDAMNLPSDDLQISHVTELRGRNSSVPEPTTIALLGLGLIGLFVTRRRYASKTV